MGTVLVIGAGISRAAAPANASVARRPPLDGDFAAIADAVDADRFERVEDFLLESVGEYTDELLESLETTTTYLYQKAIDSSPRSSAHAAFLDMLSLLATILAETTNPLRIGPRSLIYRFLLSELRRAGSPRNLAIVTFNYDLVLERTLALLGQKQRFKAFAFPDSYKLSKIASTPGIAGYEQFPELAGDGDGITLLKLHGSMNWQSVHTSQTPNPSALFNPRRDLHVVNSPRIGDQLSWTRGTDECI